ncbi:MAG: AI-2E family transporter [Anaerovoracaceae bacterium]|nr:AI-2E family transporter [Anaerovoracaceae bacterium]
MNKYKEIIKDSKFVKGSCFILFNAVLLYILYAVIKNIDRVTDTILSGLGILTEAFWPLIIGLILAYLLNPLSELIDKKLVTKLIRIPDDPIKAEKRENLSHFISVLFTIIIVIAAVIAIIYGFTALLIGRLVFDDLSALMKDFVSAVVSYEDTFKNWIATRIPDGMLSEKLSEFANSIVGWISENISVTNVISTFTSIGGSVVNIVIGVIISIYLMKDKKFFLGLWRKFLHLTLPQKSNAVVTETLSEINGVLSKFIRGALLDALIIAILSSIGLSIAGLEAAVFIGVFAGICNVIPYFGPVLGMVPAFLMGLFTDGFWQGALAVIVLLVIQQIDANLIYPKIVGSSTGLHPLMVLLSVSVFGYFGGIIGMLLAVPIAGIIQLFVVKWATGKEKKIQARPETSEGENGCIEGENSCAEGEKGDA